MVDVMIQQTVGRQYVTMTAIPNPSPTTLCIGELFVL